MNLSVAFSKAQISVVFCRIFGWLRYIIAVSLDLLVSLVSFVRYAHSMSDFPTPNIAQQAAVAAEKLEDVLVNGACEVEIRAKADAQATVRVPREAFELFQQVLAEMASGNSVTVVPLQAELTTQQAADLLNVSRPYLVGLLKAGDIPHRMIGTKRRVLAIDVLEYREKDSRRRRQLLKELTEEAQTLGIEY